MSWLSLDGVPQLEEINAKSFVKPQLIFKHSTRCAISSVIKNRLSKQPLPAHIDFYYLDLIRYRSISNTISEKYKVLHESPQVLLISAGECIFDESHGSIYIEEIIQKTS
ncbi:MAG TPA: bacillithiol system redox-active protein YtxJ [Niabella sp.]|nr:bacillithiol system redox-active protein YtxJ [Niabella sp.]HOZ97504.1 bacillithiol system redox-active protein YtxJ [Niabella sp.]HQW15592.1 bacillithiol system redox-active protein YtxJ [Niabella sp.]HQX20735.1 bacillithiol system redox-active protein YtxJ [Niabella sp.]HQX40911.1 bacillithiol system redox-active protein YtxJ [Niabella sp.]